MASNTPSKKIRLPNGDTFLYDKTTYGTLYFLESDDEEDREKALEKAQEKQLEDFRNAIKAQFPSTEVVTSEYSSKTFDFCQVMLNESIEELLSKELNTDRIFLALKDNEFQITSHRDVNILAFVAYSLDKGIFWDINQKSADGVETTQYLCHDCGVLLFSTEILSGSQVITRDAINSSTEHRCGFEDIKAKALHGMKKKGQTPHQFYEVFSHFQNFSTPDDYLFREFALNKVGHPFPLGSCLTFMIHLLEAFRGKLRFRTPVEQQTSKSLAQECLQLFIAVRFKEVTTHYIDLFVKDSKLSARDVLDNKIIKSRKEQILSKIHQGDLLGANKLTEAEISGLGDLLTRVADHY
ncbi:hypothetical protein WICPIJ_009820 [Wickerhamomyces pijperi]|uniref:Uncharacterized protein n=1 Tax=Wickerhamomyces pijperi TaxID=599730 RepID=A0A9P8PKD0_WICPI|nr:hypothetical protein WICPIJ_009820 [Wickerhamomyces pijperi]